MTKQLTGELVREVGVDGVGVAVFATDATRDLVFASDELVEQLDELQFTLGEGPCLDAYCFTGRSFRCAPLKVQVGACGMGLRTARHVTPAIR
ncbi:MAG: hypothetical protein ACI9JD_001684 [Rhodococcus sp. (in: high G+C Gram-positive bacteria)]